MDSEVDAGLVLGPAISGRTGWRRSAI